MQDYESHPRLQRILREGWELNRLKSASWEFNSRPLVHLATKKEHLKEINILFVQLTEQEPFLYKFVLDYSRQDNADLVWCRIAEEIKKNITLVFIRRFTYNLFV